MIKGSKRVEIRTDDILAKIGSYDIYRFYLGEFKVGRAMKSPFRRDRNPSFSVRYSRNGDYYHIDYGDESYKGDCFSLVEQLFNLTFQEALDKINHDFGLGLNGGPVRAYERMIAPEEPEVTPNHVHIVVFTRRMTREELAYWNQYHLSADDLKIGDIYGVDKVYMNHRRIPNYGKGLRFAYFQEPYWKIYRPHAPKGEKFYPNNIPNEVMEGLDNLTQTETGIITKSRKDRLVISKIFPSVCSTQNESPAAISEENLNFIQENCRRPIIVYDNDEPGKKASRHYTETYGWKHMNVPDQYNKQGITDFADLAKAYGMNAVVNHFKDKGIL